MAEQNKTNWFHLLLFFLFGIFVFTALDNLIPDIRIVVILAIIILCVVGVAMDAYVIPFIYQWREARFWIKQDDRANDKVAYVPNVFSDVTLYVVDDGDGEIWVSREKVTPTNLVCSGDGEGNIWFVLLALTTRFGNHWKNIFRLALDTGRHDC